TGFSDIAGHWGADAITDMNTRNIINGTGDNKFEPNRDITRAEFAAVIVRALKLDMKTDTNPFYDVKAEDWYSDYVKTAFSHSLIGGYDGAFNPQLKITREEAMAIIARAMDITNLNPDLNEDQIANVLSAFSDENEIANWAQKSVASCIKTEIISGRDGKTIAPKDNITRAEVAVIIQRLLQKSNLI
ncbi:MAG: S-layer homology domain-containing protein, partial [Clostridia bacterium]|nr:S-layer homology domain-containing protein [Clostridia bacterium]